MEPTIISSRQNNLIKQVIKLKTKKYRDQEGCFTFEGNKLFAEAVKWQVPLKEVFVSGHWLEHADAALIQMLEGIREDTSVYQVSASVFEALSAMKKPEGIFCTAKKFKKDEQFLPNYVILEDVQDPGNVGTIIRTADAAGFGGIICSAGTADIYNEKVLRGAMGSVFHLPIRVEDDLTKTIDDLKNQGIHVTGTALDGNTTMAFDAFKAASGIALVLGNEAKGLSDVLRARCDSLYKIPMYGSAESLNVSVAAGICLYDIARATHENK